MNHNPASVETLLAWITTLVTPIVLILAGVRLLMTPVFLEIEYRTPNFPADRYGFTLQDRLLWSRNALDYLLNSEGISFLGDLRFEDGTSVYNQRELRHMVDVKNVVQAILRFWYLALALLLGMGVWARFGGWWSPYRQALARGGGLTATLVAGILLFVLLAFGVFFVFFHNVFFQPGTWQFLFSDTLIRLFPERFWRDSFVYVGGFAAIFGLALWYFLRIKRV